MDCEFKSPAQTTTSADQNSKSEDVQKNYLLPTLKNQKKFFLNVLKGPFQHIKNLASHFTIFLIQATSEAPGW